MKSRKFQIFYFTFQELLRAVSTNKKFLIFLDFVRTVLGGLEQNARYYAKIKRKIQERIKVKAKEPSEGNKPHYTFKEQEEISQKIADIHAEWYLSNFTKEGRREQREKFARFIEVFMNFVGCDGRYLLSEIVNDPMFATLS